MKLSKQRLKEIIKEEVGTLDELGMYQHVPDEPVSGDLLGALEEVVERWDPVTAEGEMYEKDVLNLINHFGSVGAEINEEEKWIQGAEKDIERRDTEGVCTGDKFGGPTCRSGTKRYNLAKTFRKMAKKRKK